MLLIGWTIIDSFFFLIDISGRNNYLTYEEYENPDSELEGFEGTPGRCSCEFLMLKSFNRLNITRGSDPVYSKQCFWLTFFLSVTAKITFHKTSKVCLYSITSKLSGNLMVGVFIQCAQRGFHTLKCTYHDTLIVF